MSGQPTSTSTPSQPRPVVPPVETAPLAVPQNGGPLASRPKLASALVQAVLDCQAVPHDARNQHHGYDYTSAEAILEAGRGALAKNGLCLVPVEQTVNGHEREGPDRFELVQTRLLLHVSGECVTCRSAWPIMPGPGRPLDKATAAADTLSLAYFLRDLLQMPRVEPGADVAARNDAPPAPARKEAPRRPPADNSPQKLLADLNAREPQLLADGVITAEGQLLAQVYEYGKAVGLPAEPGTWSETQVKGCRRHLRDWITRAEARAAAQNRAASPVAN